MQPCPKCGQAVLQMANKCRHCGTELDEETFFLNEGQMLAEIQAIQAEAKEKESKLQALKKSKKIYIAATPLLLVAGLGLILATGAKALVVLGGLLCAGGAATAFLALKTVKLLEALGE